MVYVIAVYHDLGPKLIDTHHIESARIIKRIRLVEMVFTRQMRLYYTAEDHRASNI